MKNKKKTSGTVAPEAVIEQAGATFRGMWERKRIAELEEQVAALTLERDAARERLDAEAHRFACENGLLKRTVRSLAELLVEEMVFAQLGRGHCSEKQAREKGCSLCVPQYAAIDQVKAWEAELEALRALRASVTEYVAAMADVLGAPSSDGQRKRFVEAGAELRRAWTASEPTNWEKP